MILPIGKRSQPKNKGFTFIELVLVVIIILVLVGLSIPQFRRPFTSIQLRNTCQNLVQLMRYVQAKAIAERRFCRINFDFEKGTFWPTIEDDISPGKFKRINGKWGRTFKVPDGISISGDDSFVEASFVTFYPDGSSDKAKIEISDSKGKAFAITTQRAISYVEIEE